MKAKGFKVVSNEKPNTPALSAPSGLLRHQMAPKGNEFIVTAMFPIHTADD